MTKDIDAIFYSDCIQKKEDLDRVKAAANREKKSSRDGIKPLMKGFDWAQRAVEGGPIRFG